MRKVIYLWVFTAVSLISTTTFAQKVEEKINVKVQEQTQNKLEVKISELPDAVTKAIGEQYAGFTIEKAYKSTAKEEIYIVKLLKGEKHIKVLMDAKGNLIKKKEKLDNLKTKLK